MKVLYLLRYYPTLTETFVNGELALLRERGLDLTVASLGARADGALQDELPDLPVWAVPRRSLRGWLSTPSAGARWLAAWQRPKDVRRYTWLLSEVARDRPDRVHVHFAGEAAEWAFALSLDLGLPFTVTVHAVDLFKPRPALGEVLRGAAAVVTESAFHVRELAVHGVSAVVVRCGPDLDRFVPRPLPDGPLRALFVGRDVPKKGLDTLLEAWPSAPPGSTLSLITDARVGLPPGVVRLGLLPPAGVRAALAAANLFVLPCRRAADGDMDGVPLALMEAMAMGRPVISTALSGIPELVDERVGWLLPADDAPTLAQALVGALGAAADPVERARRGAAGPARLVEGGFSRDAQAEGMIRVWQGRSLRPVA